MARLQLRDPPRNWALSLARTIKRGSSVDQEIILTLVGKPRRHDELAGVLGTKDGKAVERALKRLRLDSVIDMRRNLSARPPFDYYELTELGIDVVLTLAELRAIDRIAAAAQRSRGASK